MAAARVQPRLRCIGQQAKPRVARRRRRGPLLLQVLGVGSVLCRSLALVLVVGRSLVLILRQAAEQDGDEQVERHEVARHHQQHVERGRPRADGVFGVGPNVVPVLARHDDEDREHRGADAVVVGARHLGIAGGGRELRAEELHPKQREDEDAEGEGLQFVNEIVGGKIPREFIPAVEKGFKNAMDNGPLAGFPVQSMKVRLYDGSFHDVDSDSLSFELCAKIAFKTAVKQASPELLEPIMKIDVITPEENMGDIIGDLNRRRGQVEGMEDKSGSKLVKAKVPLSEMFGYVTDLRTMSSGRATSSMEFASFETAPKNVSDTVIAETTGVQQ